MSKEITFSLVKLEDEFIGKQDTFRLGDSRPGFWPSEASVAFMQDGRRRVYGTCQRAAWYRSCGLMIPGDPNTSLIWKGHLGKQVEKAQVEKWKQMGIWETSNIKFYDRELVVSGEVDAIIKHPETGGLVGYEIKSFYGYPANKKICGAKRDGIAGVPRMAQFLQAAIYSFKFRDRLEEFRLMYIERGDGHRVEFKVGFEEKGGEFYPYWQQVAGPYWGCYRPEPVVQQYTVREMHDRYKGLRQALVKKELPDRDYPEYWDADWTEYLWTQGEINKTDYEKFQRNPGKYPCQSWQCSYCRFSEQCRVDSE